jgi:hypothetical protein
MAKLKMGNREVEGEYVPFTPVQEEWNEYRVGSYVIKMKMVVSEIFRAKDETDAVGNPLFLIQSTQLTSVRKAES